MRLVDEVAFGRYRLIAVIGEGAMGTVYKAHDTMMRRDVAIKVLLPQLAAEPGYRERFQREAYIAARLAEPHIIPIHEAGEIDGRLYLAMPVVDGIDLESLLKRDGPMNPRLVVKVIDQLAAALDAAHAAGLVHRDIKPSNALITGRDFAYLIDFGIAQDETATKLTRTGSVLGTLAYMAPERFTSGTADARADIYALTCVLHECLTGTQPFPGDTIERQIAGHLMTEPPRPSQQRQGVPAAFDQVIARGLAKDPDRRYRTALELAGAAEAALTQAPAPTPPPIPNPTPPPQQPAPAFGPGPFGDAAPRPAQPQPWPQPANPAFAATQLGPAGYPPPGVHSQAPMQPAGPYGYPGPPAPRRSGPRIAIIAAVIVLTLAAIGVTVFLVTRPGQHETATPPTTRRQRHQRHQPRTDRRRCCRSPASNRPRVWRSTSRATSTSATSQTIRW